MKRINLLTVAVVALAALWLLPGCSDTNEPVGEDLLTRDQVVNLDDQYGGFNFGDEDPAFGDASLVTDFGPETMGEFDDPMNGDPEVDRVRDHDRLHRYLMITWGNLDADTTIDFVTDWSGGLSVENGVVLLKRTIAWDLHDEILPRTDRVVIEWVSHTRPHYDGILVALHKILPPDTTGDDSTTVDTPDPNVPPLSVTFRTGPLTVTIEEDELIDLHRVITVDDAGNAVAFNTITVGPANCPSGFLAGHWRNVEDRPGGVFRGKWISNNGLHMGYLRGVYGPNSRGEKVFFGKWINHGGQFQGLLAGRYDSYGDRPGGTFQGVWLNRARRVKGDLRGDWATSEDVDGLGHFRGVWAQHCPTSSIQ